jgi:hypothetical protein
MAKIDIGPEEYDAFADVDFVDAYLRADSRHATAWLALTGRPGMDEKGRLIVTATRVLRRMDWKDSIPPFEGAPLVVQEATAEFAAAILEGFDLATPAGSTLQIRRQKAGSVEVEFFRDLDNPAYRPPPLPPAVWDLLKPLLGSSGDGDGILAGSISFGTDRCSRECSDLRYGGYYGFGSLARDYE